MIRASRRVFWVFVLAFAAVIGQLTYVQVFAAPRLNTDPNNTRAVEQQMRTERGLIVAADGEVLADNRKEGLYYFRSYPLGDLTEPWLGYNSLRYGRAGIERVYNAALAGELDVLKVRNILDVITGKPTRGADLILTLNTPVQQAAAEALGARKGAVVALDPRTGAVLAWASYPRYDPNTLDEDWESLANDTGKPLFDRALSGLYPPGSVFKVVVAAAALEQGVVTTDTSFEDSGSFVAGGYTVTNFGGQTYGEHSFAEAFAKSVNTTFARVGVELGAETLGRYAAAFGLGDQLPWALSGRTGVFPSPGAMDTAHVAQVSFGQGEVLVSPYEMALVAAGVANGGVIMAPYIVSEVRDYGGGIVEKTRPQIWKEAISPDIAAILTELMVRVVEEGTGTSAAISGVKVAGKTGTAEVADGDSHAWFIGFAPADAPEVAVAVIVENGGTGGAVAAPIAQRVMQTALERR